MRKLGDPWEGGWEQLGEAAGEAEGGVHICKDQRLQGLPRLRGVSYTLPLPVDSGWKG